MPRSFNKDDVNREILIEAVRPYPVIWQASDPLYKYAVKKMIAWKKINEEHFENFYGRFSLKYLPICKAFSRPIINWNKLWNLDNLTNKTSINKINQQNDKGLGIPSSK